MNLKSKTALAVLALISTGAFAQTAPAEAESTLGYNIGVVSNYSFRGITQTNYGGAVQGGVDYAHKSGFYVGAWASTWATSPTNTLAMTLVQLVRPGTSTITTQRLIQMPLPTSFMLV